MTSGAFSGTSSAWFNKKHLKEDFVAALRAFPLSKGAPLALEGGFWSKETPRTLDHCHVGILIRPYDSRGALLVQVDLATVSSAMPERDRQQFVTTRFLADYAAIDTFASQLELALDQERESAILTGLGD